MRSIGSGGMGDLYLAKDPHISDRAVAIKLLRADLRQPEIKARFAREARAAGSLHHPNIVTVYDYGELDDGPFLVMEFIQGETLKDLIQRRDAVPLYTKMHWLEQLCNGLAHAHSRGVIHRDIKPTNLMLDEHGTLKILDFGIARLTDHGATAGLTQHGRIIGTPGYMSPEQIRGGAVDARSDVFAAGAVGYELLTRRPAFSGDAYYVTVHKVLNEEPPAIRTLAPEVSEALAQIVERALSKAHDQRPSADEMRFALESLRLALPPQPTPPPDGTPGSRLSPPTPRALMRTARYARDLGDYRRALELVEQLLEANPDDREACELRDDARAKLDEDPTLRVPSTTVSIPAADSQPAVDVVEAGPPSEHELDVHGGAADPSVAVSQGVIADLPGPRRRPNRRLVATGAIVGAVGLIAALAYTLWPSQPVPNQRPTVSASCDPCAVEAGGTVTLTAAAVDPENESLTFQWTTSAGSVGNAAGPIATWTAPGAPGVVQATVSVTDPAGESVVAAVELEVLPAANPPPPPPLNRAPTALVRCGNPACEAPHNGTLLLVASGTDPDGDRIGYRWRVSAGVLNTDVGPDVVWTPPGFPASATAVVTVTDVRQAEAAASVTVAAAGPPAPPRVPAAELQRRKDAARAVVDGSNDCAEIDRVRRDVISLQQQLQPANDPEVEDLARKLEELMQIICRIT